MLRLASAAVLCGIDTLPSAPIERLSILRLDGDMYASTVDAFTHLYNKLSVGGFVIVDDYGALSALQPLGKAYSVSAANPLAASPQATMVGRRK